MREIPFGDLRIGMVIGRDVAPDKRVLFPAGTVVKPSTVNLLRARRVKSVTVKEPSEIDAATGRKVLEAFRDSIESQTGSILDRLREGVGVARESVNHTVEGIFELVGADRRALVNLYHVAGDDSYLYTHSINTAILAAIVGRSMGYDEERLAAVAAGALLHDVGMLELPAGLLTKPGKLTGEEWAQVMRHPDLGTAEASRIADFPLLATLVIAQHQERMDGSGYPLGLKGSQITEEARLVAICDTYEALTAPRPYRDAAIEIEVMRRMAEDARAKLDGEILEAFLKVIPIYPPGSRVLLSNGQTAIVVGSSGNPFRPVVELSGGNGNGACARSEVNLAEAKFFRLHVKEVLRDVRAAAPPAAAPAPPEGGGDPPSAG